MAALLWGLRGPCLTKLATVRRIGRACHPLQPRKYCIDARRHHIPLLDRMAGHGDRVAVISRTGQGEVVHSSYRDILRDAHRLALTLEKALPGQSEEFRSQRPPRVAVIMPRDRHYVTAMAAVWLSSLMFVPIHPKHPKSEVEYLLRDSAADIVLVHPSLRHLVPPPVSAEVHDQRHRWVVMEYDLPLHKTPTEAELPRPPTASGAKELDASDLHEADTVLDRGALLIYTSGTTGKPKGVVSSHRVLSHQITSLVQAWEYTHTDRLLHVLPLHHLHGLLNKLMCVLWAGGTVEFAHDTSAEALWRRLAAGASTGSGHEGALSMFMAVPTIYALMMQVYREEGRMDELTRRRGVEHLRSMRLIASGSAALPVTLFRELESVTGQPPLERYGMTELGMVLSNDATQPHRRIPGYVGLPMPGVQVRVVDPETEAEVPQGQQGELRVRGPTVFLEYWRRPEATREAFDAQGWFKTGDVAIFNTEKNSIQLLGRLSSDIIKSGGYKISSLEIEEAIREHDAVGEVVVVGRPHAIWGEEIVAVTRLHREAMLDLVSLQSFLSSRLAKYKLPTVLHLVNDIPKNAMGKVNKKTLLQTLGLTAPPQ